MEDKYKEPKGFVKKETYIFEKTLLEPVNVLVTEKRAGKFVQMICAIPTQYINQLTDWVHLGIEDKWYKAMQKHEQYQNNLLSEVEQRKEAITENLRNVIAKMEMTKNG